MQRRNHSCLESQSRLNENAESIPQAVRAARLRQAQQRIVKLYEAWHAAEPDMGHAAQATEWRSKLAATSQPTPQPAP